ncbi:hypothetical protein ACQPZX_29665 [Actinoplanes sp. CA-142083]|uniref:hypothetical protein n=1 Tax=Actinoplanes sp. CA-142083 TaxID=3239903 RepID=UPI003D89DC58
MISHIHVEKNLNRNAAARGMLAATFGLVADSPATVTTGCGLTVAYAMTSAQPEKVTCLPCRDHAARWHLAAAADMRLLSPGSTAFTSRDLLAAAAHHREQARRFGG